MIILYIIVVIVILFDIYNDFVKLNNQVKEAFLTMDVYLKIDGL
jgi:hypothetical protein